MKRLAVLFVVLAVLSACAPQTVEKIVEVEVEKPVEIIKEVPAQVKKLRWLSEFDVTKTAWLAQEYRKLTGIDIEVLYTQAPDGSTAEILALFAAGQPPDIYSAYGGRTSQFYDECIPLDLDAGDYVPGILDVCKNSAGEVVAVPIFYWAQLGGLVIPIMDKYDLWEYVPDRPNWTWDEFNALVDAFVQVRAEDEYVTAFYAASGSGDYWMQMWEKGWGAHPLYDNGKLDVDTPEMAAAWQWMKDMIAKGYAPAGAEGMSDQHAHAIRADNKMLFFGSDWGRANMYVMSYPSVDGSWVPVAVAPTNHVAIRGLGHDAEARAFVRWLAEKEQAGILVQPGNYAARADVPVAMPELASNTTDAERATTARNWNLFVTALHDVGTMDIGIGSLKYQDIRTLRAQKLAEMFAGKDVRQALAEFQAEGAALLGQ